MDFFIKRRYNFIVGIVILVMIIFIIEIDICSEAAKKAISIFEESVLPVLLPFFVLSDFLKNIGAAQGKSPSLYIYIVSAMSGYPMSPKLVDDFAARIGFDGEWVKKTLSYTFVTGPAFIVGAVGYGFLGSSKLGFIIAISHYFAAVINGLTLQNKNFRDVGNRKFNTSIKKKEKKINLFEQFTLSIFETLKSMGIILSFMILFMVFTELLDSLLLSEFGQMYGAKSLIKGMIEMTVGCSELAGISIPIMIKTIIASFLVSFGGLSVIFQAKSMLSGQDISIFDIIKIKFKHGIISAILALIIYLIVIG